MSSLTKTTYKRGLETPSMSRHDDYLHAPLQLFHHAVKLDMQNMNLGGESWWFKKKQKQIRIPLLVLLENDKMVQWITTAVCVCECEKPGPCIERGLPVGTMDATTPTPSPSLLPSGHSSGHAHGCYSSAWLNASVPQNKGAECPLKIHPVHSLPTRRPFSGSSPPESKTNTLWTPFFFSRKVTTTKKRFSRINNSSEITD